MIEKIIEKYDTGFYVDLGCSEEREETRKFEEAGWKGLHVDARINYAVYSYDGEIEFYDLSHLHPHLKFYSGVKEKLYVDIIKQRYFPKADIFSEIQPKKIQCKKLETILDENNITEVTFLKMDIEGSEYDVLSVFPFDKYKIDYIFIEGTECDEMLKSNGFRLIGTENYNGLYEHIHC